MNTGHRPYVLARQSCTDKAWGTDSTCTQLCHFNNPSGGSTISLATEDGNSSHFTYCCGQPIVAENGTIGCWGNRTPFTVDTGEMLYGFPISVLVNSLVFLVHPDTSKTLFPHFADKGIIDRLVHVLNLAFQAYTDEELDRCGLPLIRLSLQVAQIAPPHARARMQELLLPTEHDRKDILGTGDLLSAKC